MIIEAELLERWNKLKSIGDVDEISKTNPRVSIYSISRALKGESCNWETFETIAKFYKDRQDRMEELTGSSKEEAA